MSWLSSFQHHNLIWQLEFLTFCALKSLQLIWIMMKLAEEDVGVSAGEIDGRCHAESEGKLIYSQCLLQR